MLHTMVRMLAAAVVTSLVVVLAGCAAPTPVPTPGPATASATPTPTAEPAASRPTPRFDVDCAGIAALADFTTLLDTPVATVDPALASAGSGREIPRVMYVEAVGGLACEWSNGTPHSQTMGTAPDYRGIEVQVFPEAGDQWAKFAQNYGEGGTRGCSEYLRVTCDLDVLVNGYWITARVAGVVTATAVESGVAVPEAAAFFDALESAVGALGAPGPEWAPSPSLVLPSDCAALPSAAAVAALIGTDQELLLGRSGGGGWSNWAGARVESGGIACGWQTIDDATAGRVETLPAGEWAARATLPGYTVPSVPAPFAVEGLGPDDEAFLRCGAIESYSVCVVDVIIGGNWVQIDAFGADQGVHTDLDARGMAEVLATAVAAGIRG